MLDDNSVSSSQFNEEVDENNAAISILPTGLSFSVSAPGKVILYGEHSVVYNKLALAASLGLRTRLTFTEIEPNEDSRNKVIVQFSTLGLMQNYDLNILQNTLLNKRLPLLITPSDYNWEHPDLVNFDELLPVIKDFIAENANSSTLSLQQNLALCSFFYLFTAILQSVNVTVEPFLLRIGTDLTISAGTGSSASFSVTIAAALIHYIRIKASHAQLKNLSKQQYKISEPMFTDLSKFNEKELSLISQWAYTAEKIIHGSPSGIDNTICTYGSVVQFRKSGGIALIPNCEFKLLLINTLIQRDTKRLVEHVAALKGRHSDIVDLILQTMDAVSLSALTCLQKLSQHTIKTQSGEPTDSSEIHEIYNKLLEVSDINQHLLQSLGVSHPTLDKICALIKDAGLSGKLTGAGGGGYAIALIPPYTTKQTTEQLIDQLSSEGFQPILTNVGGPGVTID